MQYAHTRGIGRNTHTMPVQPTCSPQPPPPPPLPPTPAAPLTPRPRPPGGWQPDDWCTEAKCTFGPTGCSVRSWTYYIHAVLESLTVALTTGTFLYGLSVGVSGRKMFRRNILTIVLFCTLGAAVAHCFWHWAVFAATVVPEGTQLTMNLIQKPVALPMFGIFQVQSHVYDRAAV